MNGSPISARPALPGTRTVPTDPSACKICHLPFAAVPCDGAPTRKCVFCRRVFQRADSARRHEKTCGAGRPSPRVYKRGRKTQACDACARIKVACDAGKPCQRCSDRSLECNYGRLCTIPAHRETQTWPTQRSPVAAAAAAVDPESTTDENERNKKRQIASTYQFLLRCTDPRVNFVNDAMVHGEPERDPQRLPASVLAPTLVPEPIPDTIDPQLLFRSFMDPYFGLSIDYDGIDGSIFGADNASDDVKRASAVASDPAFASAPASATGTWPSSPGAISLNTIMPRVMQLNSEMLQLIAQSDPDTTDRHYAAVKAFFAVADFRSLLTVFFRRHQLLAKLIHWPTFDARHIDTSLLMAIALCGAAYSHSTETAIPTDAALLAAASNIQPLAEEFIFRRLEEAGKGLGANAGAAVEVCQATYLIVILQTSVSDKENATRRRALNQRQPALVDALRRMGMMEKRGPSLRLPHDTAAVWATFVYNESCTRLAFWAMFTDGLLALFCNHAPTLAIAEMVGDLPCRDELWDAPDAEAFARLAGGATETTHPPLSLKAVVATLLADDNHPRNPPRDSAAAAASATADLAHLSVFDLYSVVGALQFSVFQYRAQALPPSTAAVVLRALDRWDRLWQAARDRLPLEQQRWLGIARHAPEFARVARRIVEVTRQVSETTATGPPTDALADVHRSRYIQCRPEFDLAVFYHFILEHGLR
ncbi:hypothetical protein HMPREF1624_03619 [Sporothrix schenckii ATCC 58251]|uniref:Zn(2)-C6 fungal-type domain-containing protein n=1 Tax=Sporothrix schenckii (strain ATCC 58251 / de Perez 2211183) TaxID=1391915 RepID=U7PXC0_SPOS1|nr:hypothetical protein HMPREF1624_03619 [Sporothrix schenckii ATCC 58251]